MTTKHLFLTLSCLLLLVIMGQSDIVLAQESSQVQRDNDRHQNNLRSAWDGRGAMIHNEILLRDPEFRAALSITDEYYQGILKSTSNAMGSISHDPEYQKLNQEAAELFRTLWGVEPGMNSAITSRELERMRNADPEVLRRAEEVGQQLQLMQHEYLAALPQRHAAAWEDALPPELEQKMLEAQLAAMDESSTITPRVFEALNLTDAQREQMERIKNDLEPELKKHVELRLNNGAKISERVNAALDRHQRHASAFSFGRRQDAPEDWETVYRKLLEEPEHKKLLDESYASHKAFTTLFRERMFEIFNDEQRKRLQELIDNPPPHAQILIQRLRRENWGKHEAGEDKKVGVGADAGTDAWTPGPNAWRPGDPLPPGAYRQERGTRDFPRQAD